MVNKLHQKITIELNIELKTVEVAGMPITFLVSGHPELMALFLID